jgi:hypothetical protein
VAELADALDSGSSARKGVRVQIPASAPYFFPSAIKPISGFSDRVQAWSITPSVVFLAELSSELFAVAVDQGGFMAKEEGSAKTIRVNSR